MKISIQKCPVTNSRAEKVKNLQPTVRAAGNSVRRSHIRFTLVNLAFFLFSVNCFAAVVIKDDVQALSKTFWAWRATQQPFTSDDIPRLDRTMDFEVDWSPSAVRRYELQIAQFEAQWRAVDRTDANIADQVDWRLLGSAIARVRWELEVLPGWKRNPFFYIDQSLGSVYALLLPSPPLQDERQEAILRRLQRMPAILDMGYENLSDMRAPYVRTTLKQLASAEKFMAAFKAGLMPSFAPVRKARLEKALDEATAALLKYREWLKERQHGLPENTAVGRDAYLYFLRNVALVPYSPEQIRRIGREEWQRAVSFEALQQAADIGLPQIPLFPSVEVQVTKANEQEEEIREYLVSHRIMSVPTEVKHYKNLPIPPYIEPLEFMGVTDDLTGSDRLDDDGTSYKGDPDKQTAFFKVVSAHDPRPLIFHEGVPGHYLQLAWSWHHTDPIRRHYYDSESNEGIGYYSEEMMQVAGSLDSSPRSKEYIYSMMRLRALRVEVDVKLALGEFSLEQAAHYLETTVPMDHETALQEASMFTITPGQAITYELGKSDILSLMTDDRLKEGKNFSLQKFHDYVWLNGNLPFSLQRWEMLGDASAVPPVASTFAWSGGN
jgi:uncharacterized protein (DUF885 family)